MLKDRIRKLEEEAWGNTSRNLFDDSAQSRLDLLQRDIEELRNDKKLDLASSEVNQWLKNKLNAFIETPEMNTMVKNEIRTFGNCFQVLPSNLSADAR